MRKKNKNELLWKQLEAHKKKQDNFQKLVGGKKLFLKSNNFGLQKRVNYQIFLKPIQIIKVSRTRKAKTTLSFVHCVNPENISTWCDFLKLEKHFDQCFFEQPAQRMYFWFFNAKTRLFDKNVITCSTTKKKPQKQPDIYEKTSPGQKRNGKFFLLEKRTHSFCIFLKNDLSSGV